MSEVSIKIGGYKLPPPSSYQVSFEDLDSDESKRYISSGKMRRKRIRAEVMKITVTYNLCDLKNVFDIIKAIRPQTYTANLYAMLALSETILDSTSFSYKTHLHSHMDFVKSFNVNM